MSRWVMVVLGEILGELEARPFIACHDLLDDAGAFENREVPVHRTLREVVPALDDLRDRERRSRRREHLEEFLAVSRVALAVSTQAGRRDAVEIIGHEDKLVANRRESSGLAVFSPGRPR